MSVSDSPTRERYFALKKKGCVILDVQPDTVARPFLEAIVSNAKSTFPVFFNEFVIVVNKKHLKSLLLDGICKGSDIEYQKTYLQYICSVDDGRAKKATIKQLKFLKDCKRQGVPRRDYITISGRKRMSSGRSNTPIRVTMHVHDLLDLRAGASIFNVPLWEYIGILISEGMLKMFIDRNASSDEKMLLSGRVSDDVKESLVEKAKDALCERIVQDYRNIMKRTYAIDVLDMRRDFDSIAMTNVRNTSEPELAPLPAGKLMFDPALIDLPCPEAISQSLLKYSFMPGDELSGEDVQTIIDKNGEQMLEQGFSGRFIDDPVVAGAVSEFRRLMMDGNATKPARIRECWNRVRAVIRGQVRTIMTITEADGSNVDVETLVNEICQSMFSIMVSNDVIPSDMDELLVLDEELMKKVRAVIDDASFDGGLTKSEIRHQIGRNHTRYMPAIDEILAYLVESGKYALRSDRYIVVRGNAYIDRMTSTVRRGRPKADAGKPLVRRVDGRMDDYLP